MRHKSFKPNKFEYSMKIELLAVSFLVLVIGTVQAFGDNSTQTTYCKNGVCYTGSITIPANETFEVVHLPIIFVSYSQTCENMIKNNISGCPSVESMVNYDTSNQYVSGKFITQGNQTIRTSAEVKEHWKSYQASQKTIVCIDCEENIQAYQQSQNIIIQPTSYSFADKTGSQLITNQLFYSNDRYMQGCDTATISNIPGLLNDTINYMLSGCTKTNFNGNVTKSVHVTAWQYDNPFSTLHTESYLKDILHGHYIFGNMTGGGLGPSDCIRHQCSFTDPFKKAGW